MVDEARDLPKYITTKDLAPVRDELAECVSQSHRVHIPIGEPEAQIQTAEPAAAEFVNSSEAEVDQEDNEMVTRQKMGLARFVPGIRPSGQQQPLLVSQTPPPILAHS